MKRICPLVLFVFMGIQSHAYIMIHDKALTPKSTLTLSKTPNTLTLQVTSGVVVPLGAAASFALFTVNGAVGNTGVSNIIGNVGANVGSITGFGPLNLTGSIYNNNSVTAQCVTDLMASYTQLSAITPTATHLPILGNGETLYTGVYNMAGAGSANGVLTLDAQGDPNAEFIFKIGGAFTTGALTTVVLINGASASNVYWVAEGAISMAASTTMKGTMIANNAAISMGAGGNLEGRMFSTTGAVSVYGDSVTIPVGGFVWIGAISTNWNTGANWLGGVVPAINDDSYVGVNLPFVYFPAIPASSGSVSVGSITFGTMGGQAAGVVINTGSTLNVTRAITYQSDISSGLGYTCTLSGQGTINVNSINVIASSPSISSYTQIFGSSVANLNVTTNIALTSSNYGAVLLNATFNLTGGTALVSGLIQTSNTASSTSSFIVNPATTAILQLINGAAFSGLSGTGTNIISLKNTGAAIEYSGASQTVYTDADITGLAGGISYQNIKFSGTGIKTASTGNLNIAGDYTTTLVNDASNYVNLAVPTVNFNGTTQSLAGGAGNGTTLYNVAFSGPGIKTMTGGKFYVASTGILTMATGASLDAGGILTLNSDINSSAIVAAIPAGGSIIGNVNVQRFIKGSFNCGPCGDLSKRGYRLISSAVYTGTDASGTNVFDLQYLLGSVYVSGLNGISNGFNVATAINNASLYLFREDDQPPPSNGTLFTTGYNWKGIARINNTPAYNIGTQACLTTTNVADTTTTIPVGNGVLFFFRGNNTLNNGSTAGTKLTSPFNYPEDVTLTQIGKLNSGTVNIKLWFANAANSLGTTLSYTAANVNNGTSSLRGGYTCIGNPYASTINWEKYNNNAALNAITGGGGLPSTIWVFNEASKQFEAYIPALGSDITSEFPAGSHHTGSASNMIASGQGFFIQASAKSQTLTFNETAKSSIQPTAANLNNLMGKSKEFVGRLAPELRLKMLEDSINTDEILIVLNNKACAKFVSGEDAADIGGSNALVSLSSFSSDTVQLAINSLPFPGLQQQVIPILVNAASSGSYQLERTQLDNLPQLYDVWLKDAFTTDSLDLKASAIYKFNIDKNDPATFGANRFTIVIRQDTAFTYRLLTFTATKADKTSVQLAWKTANEENYTNFTVERSTDNGKTFDITGGFPGTAAGVYSLLDKNPVNGLNLYRLKQEDINNTTTYSKVIPVQYTFLNNTADNLRIFPNPSTSIINLTIVQPSDEKTAYSISIMSGSGVIVKQMISQQPSWQANISNLLPGAYVIKVMNNSNKSMVGESKFVKL